MNGHLTLPYKSTPSISSSALPQALKSYITEHFKTISPEAFSDDIARFCKLRKAAVEDGLETHRESAARLVKYHANVAYLLSKLPPDIGLAFPYATPFPLPYTLHTPPPVALPTLSCERFAVLQNLAACYANLGAAESRTSSDSLKRAKASFQNAAGIFNLLITSLLSSLPSLERFNPSVYDFKPGYLESMKCLCEAMAQECFWKMAVQDKQYKNGLVAKLSLMVSELYDQALLASQKDHPTAASYLPKEWIALMTVKKHHFAAAAEYRMSVEDLEKDRYGNEIARLEAAKALTKKALDAAKKGLVSEGVQADIRALNSTLVSSLTRAHKDNDLIYLQIVPPLGELPAIKGARMAEPVLPKEVEDSLGWLMREGGGLGWEGLVDYGVHLAISVYDDRKDSFVRDEIVARKFEIDQIETSTLQSLNLPGALQAVERPMGLPPSLMGMSEDVRRERGPERIRQMLSNIAASRSQADALLNESLDILDQEAEEDEALRIRYAERWTRPASHVVNGHLVTQANTFRQTLEQSGSSDLVVSDKWDEWEDKIEILAADEESLMAQIPRLPPTSSLTANPLTRLLHTLLERLQDLSATRSQLTSSARSLAERDDIRPIVINEANAIQRDSGAGEVRAEWFENTFEKELRKYEAGRKGMEENRKEVERVLDDLRVQNDAFLASRKTSPVIKAREKALQDLDVAYHKYKEIVRNLEEGTRFYSDLLILLSKFKDSCSDWAWSRRSDVSIITASLDQASIFQQHNQASPSPPAPSPSPPRSSLPQSSPLAASESSPISAPYAPPPAPRAPQWQPPHPSSNQWRSQPLPNPHSAAWDTQDLPPPQPPALSATPKKRAEKKEQDDASTPRRSERNRKQSGIV